MARNYKQEVANLVEAARRRGYRVRFDWSSHTWRGMNPEAARWLKAHGEYGDVTKRVPTKSICLNKHTETNNKKRSETLRHELIELHDMKRNGHSYPRAHRIASRKQFSIRAVR